MFATLKRSPLTKQFLRYGFSEYIRRDNMEKAPISTTSKHYNKQFYNPEYHANIMQDGPELLQLSHKKNPPSRLDFSEVWDSYYQVVMNIWYRSLVQSCLALCFCVVFSIHSSQNGLSIILMRKDLSVSISEESMHWEDIQLEKKGNKIDNTDVLRANFVWLLVLPKLLLSNQSQDLMDRGISQFTQTNNQIRYWYDKMYLLWILPRSLSSWCYCWGAKLWICHNNSRITLLRQRKAIKQWR